MEVSNATRSSMIPVRNFEKILEFLYKPALTDILKGDEFNLKQFSKSW